MNIRSPPIDDDDPTSEEEALDYDPTRTDQLSDAYRVSAESQTGVIEHDERGRARWKWRTESTPTDNADKTFDQLRALDNDALALEQGDTPPPDPPKAKSGYDPYDTGVMPGPLKPRPRKR
jgi:hypothetical protein